MTWERDRKRKKYTKALEMDFFIFQAEEATLSGTNGTQLEPKAMEPLLKWEGGGRTLTHVSYTQ